MDVNGPLSLDPYAHGIASGYDNPAEMFLGPPLRPAQGSPYERRNVSKWEMSENYYGKNEYLRDTMEDFMWTAQQTWYTEEAMPWFRTDQIYYEWTVWENNAHYMGVTPHQATSNVVTQKRQVRKASSIRRGIAAEFELDFMSTPLGRASFVANLAQMARAVQETANVEVIRSLLHCHRYQHQYLRNYVLQGDDVIDEYWRRKTNRFMKAQKTKNGLERLDAEIRSEMNMYNAEADMWILPQEVMDYLSTVPAEKTDYYLGGQEAVDRLNGRPMGKTAAAGTQTPSKNLNPIRMINDSRVFLARSYIVDANRKMELLSRLTEVGVYNLMVDRCRNYNTYSSDSRTIRVYDNDRDQYAEITLEEAIQNSVVWDKHTGDLLGLDQSVKGMRSEAINRDMKYDFLSFVDTSGNNGSVQRKNCEYIGDMPSMYLKTKTLLDAGRTVLNAAMRQAGVDSERNVVTNSDIVAAAIYNIIGDDNRLVTDPDGIDNFITGSDSVPIILAGGDAPLLFPTEPVGAQAAPSETYLRGVLGAGVPDTHKQQLDEIIGSRASEEDKADSIKELILQCNSENPGSTGPLKDKRAISAWYRKRKTARAKELAKAASSAPAGGQGIAMRYIRAGEPLPEGWQYLVPEDANATRKTNFVARSIMDFPGFKRAAGARRVGAHLPSAEEEERSAQRYLRSQDELDRAREQRKAELRGSVRSRSGASPTRFQNMNNFIGDIAASAASPLVRLCAQLYLGCRVNRDRMLSFAANDVMVPLGFILYRPHATYRTRFGIKMKGRGGTGYTFFGHSNMMISSQATHKVGMMHYTAYMAAIVLRPKNVYVVEDLFVCKYMGGMSAKFWSVEAYTRKGVRRCIKNGPSILCVPLPPGMKTVEEKVDMRGKWYNEYRLGMVSEDRYRLPMIPGSFRIVRILKIFDPTRKPRAMHPSATNSRSKAPANYVCFQGWQDHYNPLNGTFGNPIEEAGHFGAGNVYPGVGKVRNGEDAFVENRLKIW